MGLLTIIHKFQFTSHRNPFLGLHSRAATSVVVDLHNPLTDFTRRLEVISAVAVTAEVALRAQNCEQDADIALLLLPRKEHGVCIWKRDVQVLTVLAANRT